MVVLRNKHHGVWHLKLLLLALLLAIVLLLVVGDTSPLGSLR